MHATHTHTHTHPHMPQTLEKALCPKVSSPLATISALWLLWLQALLTDEHVPQTTGQEAH